MKFTKEIYMSDFTKDIDDSLDEATMKSQDANDQLPEAPASANIKVWINDYGVQFTVRDAKMNKVVERIEFLVEMAQRKGWQPTWTENGHSKGTSVKDVGSCPDCGEPLEEKESKTGKKFIKCSTNKWNYKTKQAEGCSYIKWL